MKKRPMNRAKVATALLLALAGVDCAPEKKPSHKLDYVKIYHEGEKLVRRHLDQKTGSAQLIYLAGAIDYGQAGRLAYVVLKRGSFEGGWHPMLLVHNRSRPIGEVEECLDVWQGKSRYAWQNKPSRDDISFARGCLAGVGWMRTAYHLQRTLEVQDQGAEKIRSVRGLAYYQPIAAKALEARVELK